METWLAHHRARVATKSPLGEALKYIAKYWQGLCLFLTDGALNGELEATILISLIHGLGTAVLVGQQTSESATSSFEHYLDRLAGAKFGNE